MLGPPLGHRLPGGKRAFRAVWTQSLGWHPHASCAPMEHVCELRHFLTAGCAVIPRNEPFTQKGIVSHKEASLGRLHCV